MCFCTGQDWVNCSSHMLHLHGFLPVCVRMWFLRLPAWVNCFSQVLHLSGVTPVCLINMCFLSLAAWVNCLPHILHLCAFCSVCIYGFIPVCINRCHLRPQALVNWFLQMSNLWGFSPVCINKCFVGLPGKVNCVASLLYVSTVCLEMPSSSELFHTDVAFVHPLSDMYD